MTWVSPPVTFKRGGRTVTGLRKAESQWRVTHSTGHVSRLRVPVRRVLHRDFPVARHRGYSVSNPLTVEGPRPCPLETTTLSSRLGFLSPVPSPFQWERVAEEKRRSRNDGIVGLWGSGPSVVLCTPVTRYFVTHGVQGLCVLRLTRERRIQT